MNEMQIQMKERIQRLLVLVEKVNNYVREAESSGYKVRLCCSGSMGFGATTNGTSLKEFSKDFAQGDGTVVSFNRLKASLRRVTKELIRLKNEDFYVEIKGHDRLSVKYIWTGINQLQE